MNHTAKNLPARSRIYHYLYQNTGFCSRQDLARELNLSMPTVHQNLTGLMDAGMVWYSGEQQSTGGRKSNGLAVVPDAKTAIGIYITRRQIQFVACDLLLHELAAAERPFPDAARFLSEGRSVAAELEEFIRESGLDRGKILGVTVTIPGIIDPGGTRLVLCPTMQLKDISLEGLGAGVDFPFHIENNGTSGGNAEMFFWESHENLAYLFLEDGVGGMLNIGGAPYNGDFHMSGEFGHMCVTPGGLRCNCGKLGCLEAYCSNWRISDNLGITLDEFFEGVNAHNAEYTMLWNDYLQHLAIAVNNIHSILDCDVVLGGFMIRYLKPYFPMLKEYVASGGMEGAGAEFLHPGKVEEHPAPRGAALYYIRQFIEKI